MEKSLNTIQTFFNIHNINKNSKFLIAFSGGPDSVFLTKNLLNLIDTKNFSCIHINHNLRTEAVDDENFCKQFCKQNKINLFTEKINVKEYSHKNKLSIEQSGRKLRYKIFEDYIKKYCFDYLVTGHNFDDNIETFFLRLFRGTGIQGLSCIEPVIDKKKYFIIRPVLNIKKQDILDWLNTNKINYVTDNTNFKNIYERNKIRLDLIPYIKNNFCKSLDININNLIKISELNNSFLECYIKEFINKNSNNIYFNKNNIKVNIKLFEPLHKYIKLNVIRFIINKLIFNKPDLNLYNFEFKHINYILDFIHNANSGHYIELPLDLIVCKEFDKIKFILKNNFFKITNLDKKIIGFDSLPVKLNYADKTIIISDKEFIPNDKTGVIFSFSKNDSVNSIVIRPVKSNDKFKPKKFDGHKTLKKIFSENKIGITERNKIFCIEYNNKILFISKINLVSNYCNNESKNKIFVSLT